MSIARDLGCLGHAQRPPNAHPDRLSGLPPSPNRITAPGTSLRFSDRLVAMSRTDDLHPVLAALVAGDRLAYLRISRLVTGFLSRMRAYDFRSEWPDLVQEVVAAVAAAHGDGRIRDHQALVGFVRSVTRHKLADRLKREMRIRGEARLAWEIGVLDELDRPMDPVHDRAIDLRRALASLPEKKGDVLIRVYIEGKSYEEAAIETGIPLGTLKRYLRDGLGELRDLLSAGRGE